MNFKEEFPSLNGRLETFELDTINFDNSKVELRFGILKECCLDKSKVKEAIDKCVFKSEKDKSINLFKHKDEGIVLSVDLLKLKKELGLE